MFRSLNHPQNVSNCSALSQDICCSSSFLSGKMEKKINQSALKNGSLIVELREEERENSLRRTASPSELSSFQSYSTDAPKPGKKRSVSSPSDSRANDRGNITHSVTNERIFHNHIRRLPPPTLMPRYHPLHPQTHRRLLNFLLPLLHKPKEPFQNPHQVLSHLQIQPHLPLWTPTRKHLSPDLTLGPNPVSRTGNVDFERLVDDSETASSGYLGAVEEILDGVDVEKVGEEEEHEGVGS